MLEPRGRGYVGQSMSVNAKIAYSNDEKPMSKWRKNDILDIIHEIIESENLDLDINLIKKLTLEQLKSGFLTFVAPHHTGAFYNYTNFYAINKEKVINTNNSDVQHLIDRHKQYLEETKEERKIENIEKEQRASIRKSEKEFKEHVEGLLEFSTYKTLNGLLGAIKNGKVDIKVLEQKQAEYKKELEYKRLRSELGQLRKFTEYKNVNEMIEALNLGHLDLEKLRSVEA